MRPPRQLRSIAVQPDARSLSRASSPDEERKLGESRRHETDPKNDAFADAGFLVERIPEPLPDQDAFSDNPYLYQRMREAPWYLFVRAIKSG